MPQVRKEDQPSNEPISPFDMPALLARFQHFFDRLDVESFAVNNAQRPNIWYPEHVDRTSNSWRFIELRVEDDPVLTALIERAADATHALDFLLHMFTQFMDWTQEVCRNTKRLSDDLALNKRADEKVRDDLLETTRRLKILQSAHTDWEVEKRRYRGIIEQMSLALGQTQLPEGVTPDMLIAQWRIDGWQGSEALSKALAAPDRGRPDPGVPDPEGLVRPEPDA